MSARPYQVKREQLNDRQWSDLCEFFEAVREIVGRNSRKVAAAK
jgi:hypothetical protein